MEKRTVYTKEALREISFPTATVEFTDGTFPGRVTLTGWNPLIPLNDRDSGIPAARRCLNLGETQAAAEYETLFKKRQSVVR